MILNERVVIMNSMPVEAEGNILPDILMSWAVVGNPKLARCPPSCMHFVPVFNLIDVF